jgi:hypothetical protein
MGRRLGFADAYAGALTRDSRAALLEACIVPPDETFEDLARWAESERDQGARRDEPADDGRSFATGALASSFLNPEHPRYTRAVARRLLASVLMVGWQLAQPHRYGPSWRPGKLCNVAPCRENSPSDSVRSMRSISPSTQSKSCRSKTKRMV